MQDKHIESSLIVFFEKVAQKQPELLAALRQQSYFTLEQRRWLFTLPDLHRFLQLQDKSFEQVDYTQFRSAVFNSEINRSIGKYSAKIIIADNRGKVNKSAYALEWQ